MNTHAIERDFFVILFWNDEQYNLFLKILI